MRRPTLAAAAVATVFLMGCDRIPFIGGGEEEASPPASPVTQPAATATQPADTATPPDTVAEPQPQPQVQQTVTRPPRTQPDNQATAAQGMDEPWTPTHTGTVSPGMSREAVVGVWGEPVAERASGEWTYLYYRNGCEYSCGTFDVVMLQGGEVVDAIVRGRGHTYAGTSSSPAGSQGLFTPPGGGPGELGITG
ncbi:MAG: hypothetical protein P8X82_11170 [Gemmatimonadales bacterium]|jgi:hypothetical protein